MAALSMDWMAAVIAVAVAGAYFAWKWLSQVPASEARRYLAEGALVVDVRSAGEFRKGHVPAAVNIPLGELREKIADHVKNKDRVILVHCLGGGRSDLAKLQLKRMGYPSVFNLGGLWRAKRIVMKRDP